MRLLSQVAFLSLLTLVGCGTATTPAPPVNVSPVDPLQKSATILLDISKSVNSAVTSVTSASNAGLIPITNAISIMKVLNSINTFTSQASTIIRTQANPPTAQRANLLNLVSPLLTQFGANMSANLTGIKDANTKTAVSGVLLIIQTSLIAFQGSL